MMIWLSVLLFGLCFGGVAWYFCAGAVANTALFLCVSIPLAEGRQARKEGYAAYRRETRMLLPIRKRG